MNDQEKRKQLRNFKALASGLFLLMLILFAVTTTLEQRPHGHWVGYVRAFSEAAMVGALADWFAVTALFHYPLGLKIPHTNLIQNKKDLIGDNLGSFVVENFLAPESIRPYISKLEVSGYIGQWLSRDSNQQVVIRQLSYLLLDIINKLDNNEVTAFITQKTQEFSKTLNLSALVGNGLEYLVQRDEHQRLITGLAQEIRGYILQNGDIIRGHVKKQSFSLIPRFVDDAIADKITVGLADFFKDIESSPNHAVREEISAKFLLFAQEVQSGGHWAEEFSNFRETLFKSEKIHHYAADIWNTVRSSVITELQNDDSTLKHYLQRNLSELALKLEQDDPFKQKIDNWLRTTTYKYVLRNTHHFGNMISTTVGRWEGAELSEKLELEVGKDLQFIRVNGTIVGGLVGLIIYAITQLFI